MVRTAKTSRFYYSSAPPRLASFYRAIDVVSGGYDNARAVQDFRVCLPDCHPRIMETFDSYFEDVKSLFDEVSVGIVHPTVQSYSREGGPIIELIDKKLSVRETVFFAEPMQKRSRRISAVPTEQRDIEINFVLRSIAA